MNISQAVKKRLEHIEFLLFFRGWVSRHDLTQHFGIGAAAATRDFRSYNDLCPHNMSLNNTTKRWEVNPKSFSPLFEHAAATVFAKLRNLKIGDALGIGPVAVPPRLSLPKVEILAEVTRAIVNKSALKVDYVAASRGSDSSEIVPHSLVDNGIRWHVRSYDRARGCFWDFVLGRITSAESIQGPIQRKESIEGDEQWNRIVRLELAPHPDRDNVRHPEAIATEYGMENNVLVLPVRAAIASYWLRLWSVDCSPDQSKKGKEYQLCLRNPLALYDIQNALLAPGYKKPG
ncbi:WYL domain-containing protein [Marinobacter sp. SS13-12]|uniref:WYL domain-containing protein n=1 Tax=Marinobacter sp. SS13-12 TaxID=3050451 RepID=UPI0025532AA8|nr:WYL domain-containing protein [Marinobacter sp. SS13-12]MDK8465776.1 WYL domain-containing protein [Marinobacter sp. SS13-12]